MIPDDVMQVIDDNAENLRDIASSLGLNADDLLMVLDTCGGDSVEREIAKQLTASYVRMMTASDEWLVLYKMLMAHRKVSQ